MSRFTKVPNDVIPLLAEIGGAAISVYVALRSYANRGGMCFPTLESIAELSGTSQRTCKRCLTAMVTHGVIERQRRNLGTGRTSNLYRFIDIPRAILAPGTVAHGPKVTTPRAKSDGSPGAILAQEQEPLLNKIHLTRTSAIAPVDPRLTELIQKWNTLPLSIVPTHVRTDPVASRLVTRFRTALKTPELREALIDPDRILAAMRKAKFAHGKSWATLLGLLATNRAGEYKLVCLLNGAYDGNDEGMPAAAEDRFSLSLDEKRRRAGYAS